MRIVRAEVMEIEMSLSDPYQIAYETVDTATNIVLRLETNTGLLGYGCAAPDLMVTGETPRSVMEVFEQLVHPMLLGADPFRMALHLEELKEQVPQAPSARAMVDMALHDLLACHAGLPLYRLLGGYRSSISTSITIGILNEAETLEVGRRFWKQGFRILKVKGGLDLEADIRRLLALRKALGPELVLRFDANQGYTAEEAIHFAKAVQKDIRVEILEQPTPKDRGDWLGKVVERAPIPVMADESLLGLRDAFRLARHSQADMVNIKLMKVGGIQDGLQVNSVARSAGIEAMVGCMDESALGIAAGLHFALSRPNIEFADLDGHLDLLGDPFEGLVRLENGIMYPNSDPGLGLGAFRKRL